MTEQKETRGREPKITDKELENELKAGKTQKQIAHEYGYGHPSRRLKDRIWELGFETRQKLNENGNDYYVPPSTVEKAIEKAGLNKDETVYFESNITEDGTIEIKPTERKWRRKKDE